MPPFTSSQSFFTLSDHSQEAAAVTNTRSAWRRCWGRLCEILACSGNFIHTYSTCILIIVSARALYLGALEIQLTNKYKNDTLPHNVHVDELCGDLQFFMLLASVWSNVCPVTLAWTGILLTTVCVLIGAGASVFVSVREYHQFVLCYSLGTMLWMLVAKILVTMHYHSVGSDCLSSWKQLGLDEYLHLFEQEDSFLVLCGMMTVVPLVWIVLVIVLRARQAE